MKNSPRRKKLNAIEAENWPLVGVAVVMMLCGLCLAVVPLFYLAMFGWWALVLIASGVSTVLFCIEALRENDPSWLMLDLILPK